MPRARRRSENAGFTLVEILVTIAILVVVLGAVTSIMLSSARLSGRTSRRVDVQGGTRQAMSLMTTELRQAGADPSIPPVGIVGIVSGDSISIRVRSDLSGDGVIQTTEPSEDVTYTYNPANQTLTRNPGAGAVTFLSNVSTLRLTYFDSADSQLTALPLNATDASNVHSIGLTMTVTERDALPLTLATRVYLRNR